MKKYMQSVKYITNDVKQSRLPFRSMYIEYCAPIRYHTILFMKERVTF